MGKTILTTLRSIQDQLLKRLLKKTISQKVKRKGRKRKIKRNRKKRKRKIILLLKRNQRAMSL
jgi:hypothetical protein